MDSNQQVSVLLSVLAIFWGNIYLASKNFTIEEAFFYHLSSLLSAAIQRRNYPDEILIFCSLNLS